ncbi:MAG: potassium-transporting ATPase subunit F [Acidimicrobiales bacterium]|nr:potassium-transporting ATPase subunit F [Acidimicrobiales bacterium]
MLAAAVMLAAVSAVQNWIGLGLAVLLAAYLVAVLVVPERF